MNSSKIMWIEETKRSNKSVPSDRRSRGVIDLRESFLPSVCPWARKGQRNGFCFSVWSYPKCSSSSRSSDLLISCSLACFLNFRVDLHDPSLSSILCSANRFDPINYATTFELRAASSVRLLSSPFSKVTKGKASKISLDTSLVPISFWRQQW